MFLYFKASAKNERVLKAFYKFLTKLKNLPTTIKHSSKSNRRKFITVLKSPHVNKTAQEQFEFRFYNKQFSLHSLNPSIAFVILKKIRNSSFPGIKLEVKGLLNVRENGKSLLKTIDPDNFVLDRNSFSSNKMRVAQKKYLQLFDCYGESYLQNFLCCHNKLKD